MYNVSCESNAFCVLIERGIFMASEKNVLVVDDEAMIRESVSAYITRATMFLPPRMAKRRWRSSRSTQSCL